MTAQLRTMLGTHHIGTTSLNLLSSSLAPTTNADYDNGVRQLAAFCHEEGIHSLQATSQSLVRYTAWLGLQGTVAAASLQKYYSAVDKFLPRPPATADCRRRSTRGRTTRTRNASIMTTSGKHTPTVTGLLGPRHARRRSSAPRTLAVDTAGTTPHRYVPGYAGGVYQLCALLQSQDRLRSMGKDLTTDRPLR
jgi:hypothetical protein